MSVVANNNCRPVKPNLESRTIAEYRQNNLHLATICAATDDDETVAGEISLGGILVTKLQKRRPLKMISLQKRSHLQGSSLSALLLMLLQMLMAVKCDYPPPSEDGPGYYSSEWNSRDWAMLGNPNPGKCVPVPANMTLCHGIGYDQMRIPNLLEHETLKEATSQAQTWVRLLGLRCHADTQVFLCSLFAPVCLDRPIWPCRSLCDAVQAGCEDRMLKYGFPWPEMLRCDKYPSEEELCIGLRPEQNPEADPSCSVCRQPDTFESTVDHYCQSDFAMRIKVKQAIVNGSDMKIDTEKKKKIFKAGSLLSSDLRDASLYLVNGSSCDCETLDSAKNGSSFIIMGNMVRNRPVLSFIHRIDRKSKDVNRAMRVARKPDVCTKTDVIGAQKAPPTGKKVTGSDGKAKTKSSQLGKSNRKGATPSSESKKPVAKSKLSATTTPSPPTKRANRNKKERKKNSPATPPLFY